MSRKRRRSSRAPLGATWAVLKWRAEGLISITNRLSPLPSTSFWHPFSGQQCASRHAVLPYWVPQNPNKILEPKSGKEIDPEDLDIIFIPLLAFDKNLNRVGMGKGYYDKTLHGKKAGKLVGLAYDFQEISNAFPEDHDVAMNAIITSKNIFTHEKTY